MNVREFFTCWPVRKKLSFLLLVIFCPTSWIIIASSLDEREHELERAGNDALLMVQSLAAQQEQVLSGTKQMLSTLAQLPEIHTLDADACNELFVQLNKQYPFYSVLAAATPDGNMFAASTPFMPSTVNLADRKHIKDALRSLDFSAGEYIVGRASKTKSINYAFPVLKPDKSPLVLLIAGFKLEEYAHFIKNAHLPEGYVVVITDHKGVRLFRIPESDNAVIGKPISPGALEAISSNLDHGIFEKTADDGVYRIYAYKQLRLKENEQPYLYIFVGIPKHTILARANAEILRNLTILGLAGFAALSVVWLLARNMLIKPIQQLVAATQRFGSGELSARTFLPHSSDELGRLAQSFDEMASLLERRDIERKEAEEALKHAYDDLEHRVGERTCELTASNDRLAEEIKDREQTERILRASEERYRLVFENSPLGIIHFDEASRITNCNDKFAEIIGASKEKIIGFNLLLQMRSEQARRAVTAALAGKASFFEGDYVSVCGNKPSYIRALYQRIDSKEGGFMGGVGIYEDITERKHAEKEREQLIGELQAALSEVKLLGGLLPICANCKKIRDDQGYWQQIETYIREHSEATFSHSICPECANKLYPHFIKK